VALITTGANKDMERIHNRMPVILPEPSWSAWLDTENVKPSMQPFLRIANIDGALASHPVSREVNRNSTEGPELTKPIGEVPPPEPERGQQLDLF